MLITLITKMIYGVKYTIEHNKLGQTQFLLHND